MKILIVADNIRAGGGLTHLKEITNHLSGQNLKACMVVASQQTLDHLKPHIKSNTHPFLNKNLVFRWIWRTLILPVKAKNYDLVFFPGAGYLKGHLSVSMCQNLLPLDRKEGFRYFPGFSWFRLIILRWIHLQSFQKAQGVIFLNQYSFAQLPVKVKVNISSKIIIPHGISSRFFIQRPKYSTGPVFKLIYVSQIDLYKHQWHVAIVVYHLRQKGYPLQLHLVGDANNSALHQLEKVMRKHPEDKEGVIYHGAIEYEKVHTMYKSMDIAVYASSCESFGLTVLEAMASGLPVACSERSAMPGLLKDAGIYFDPEDLHSIETAILALYADEELRRKLGNRAQEYAREYSWQKTSQDTMAYLLKTARLCAGS